MTSVYLDSSAIVKLAVIEPESDALRRYLRRRMTVSSALSRTEVTRAAVVAGGESALRAARTALSKVNLLRINDRLLNAAGVLPPLHLGTLDAIHLATAQDLGDEVSAFVTYDTRLADAAREMGYRVSAPS